MRFRVLIPLTLFCSLLLINNAGADNQRVGRYLTKQVGPLATQQDLLQQTFQITFPESVNTVDEAINYLLRFSGYALDSSSDMDEVVDEMLQAPLPEADRTFGPMTLEAGLLTLAGNQYQLIIDPVNRSVNYRLLYKYQPILKR